MPSWFYVKAGERTGPASRAELDALIAQGEITGDTLVWRIGFGEWKTAGTVPELGLPPPLPPVRPRDVDDHADPNPYPREADLERGATTAEKITAPATGLEYAGFGVRMAAKLLDFMILWGIGLFVQRGVAEIWFEGAVPIMTENWDEWMRFALIAVPINTAIALTFSVYFILRQEATPGKRLLGLRVVRADGGRLKTGRAIGRYFGEQLSGILFLTGYVMAAFDEEKRTLHDYLCKTRVVKGPRTEP